jgi:hypothetical protein
VEDGLRDLDDGVVLRVCPYDGHGASDREAVVGVPQQPLQYGSVEERVRAPCVTDRAVGGGFGPRQVGLFSLLPPPLPSPGRHSATFVVEQSEFELDPGAGRSCHKSQVDRREFGITSHGRLAAAELGQQTRAFKETHARAYVAQKSDPGSLRIILRRQ